jgi:hypothetical protein
MKRLIAIAFRILASTSFAADSEKSTTTVASATTTSMGSNTAMQGSSTAPEVQTTLGRTPLDSMYLSFFSTFHGGSLNEPTSAQTVNRLGLQNTKPGQYTNINLDSEVGAGYRISKRYQAGVVVPFIFIPVYGRQTILGDVGVKVSDHDFANIGGAKITANLIVQAPTSDGSKEKGQNWALKSTPSVRYNVPRSNFTLGSFGELKGYFGVEKPGEKTFKLWMGPYARYNLNDSFALNVLYEMEYRHDLDQRGYLTLTNHQTDLQPGIVWNITPKVMLNPYLQIFTTNRVSADTTAVGAVMSAAIL